MTGCSWCSLKLRRLFRPINSVSDKHRGLGVPHRGAREHATRRQPYPWRGAEKFPTLEELETYHIHLALRISGGHRRNVARIRSVRGS